MKIRLLNFYKSKIKLTSKTLSTAEAEKIIKDFRICNKVEN